MNIDYILISLNLVTYFYEPICHFWIKKLFIFFAEGIGTAVWLLPKFILRFQLPVSWQVKLISKKTANKVIFLLSSEKIMQLFYIGITKSNINFWFDEVIIYLTDEWWNYLFWILINFSTSLNKYIQKSSHIFVVMHCNQNDNYNKMENINI